MPRSRHFTPLLRRRRFADESFLDPKETAHPPSPTPHNCRPTSPFHHDPTPPPPAISLASKHSTDQRDTASRRLFHALEHPRPHRLSEHHQQELPLEPLAVTDPRGGGHSARESRSPLATARKSPSPPAIAVGRRRTAPPRQKRDDDGAARMVCIRQATLEDLIQMQRCNLLW